MAIGRKGILIHTLENDESKVLLEIDIRTVALMFAAIGLTDESKTQEALIRNGFTQMQAYNADNKGTDEYCDTEKEVYRLLKKYYEKHPV